MVDGTHKVTKHHWELYVLTMLAIIAIGVAGFDNFVVAKLDNPDKGLDGVNIRDLYDYDMDRFVNVVHGNIDTNLALFNRPVDVLRLLVLFTRKQEIYQEMAANATVPISESIMVTTGVKHAVVTGGLDSM